MNLILSQVNEFAHKLSNQKFMQTSYLFSDNDSYRVNVKCHTDAKIYMGERMECSITEKWCECKVNGVAGWGCAEWLYRNSK